MEYLRVHLDSIQIYPSNTLDRVGGTIYFTIGDTCFPEEGWYDLISEDFPNWLPKIVSFARNHTDICELCFMDGPAKVRLLRFDSVNISVTCIYNNEISVSQTDFDPVVFYKSIVNALGKYNRFLHENGVAPQFTNEIAALKGVF